MIRILIADFIVALISTIILSACGKPQEEIDAVQEDVEESKPAMKVIPPYRDPIYQHDMYFDYYINKFKQLGLSQGVTVDTSKVVVNFGNTRAINSRSIGYCEFTTENQNRIVIYKPFWENASEKDRESLIFHELGHCALYRAHRFQFRPSDLSPLSIMHPYIVREKHLDLHWKEYIQELFSDNVPRIRIKRGNADLPVEELMENVIVD